ncbi:MAG: UDP-N-acetylmuramate dehydrogenase [Prevotella sp.]|jgi:UDP-N-acetylmuramate dehydrogenase
MKELEHYNLLHNNTFGIEAYCDKFVEYSNESEAVRIAQRLKLGDKYLILGGGSDLLLTGDFHGTVIHSAMTDITLRPIKGGVLVRVGSGRTWDDVVQKAIEQGWHGAENLSLIPGEVGASAVQNIGAYGAEVKDLIAVVEAVEIGTGRKLLFGNQDCQYSYRQSRFKHDWRDHFLITYVTYRFSNTFEPRLDYGNIRQALEEKNIENPTPQELRDVIIEIRNRKLPDPKVTGNAGSFFMNPIVTKDVYERIHSEYPDMPHYTIDDHHEKIPAGWMIEQCGWKGRSLGRAGVHDKQALVLVNRGGATGREIVDLMKQIQEDVKHRFGIDIHPEVNVV